MNLKDSLTRLLRKISGVSLGPLGVSCTARERVEESRLIANFIGFLEDRRILHSPAAGHSIASHFVLVGLDHGTCLSPHATASILEIREEIRKLLNELPQGSPIIRILKRLQATCRWALDSADRMHSDVVREDPDYEDIWGYGALDYGMTFIGLFRRKMARDIEKIASQHKIPIEGPLHRAIEMTRPIHELNRQIFQQADELVRPYMDRHAGFQNMESGWYERLCTELEGYTQDWEDSS